MSQAYKDIAVVQAGLASGCQSEVQQLGFKLLQHQWAALTLTVLL